MYRESLFVVLSLLVLAGGAFAQLQTTLVAQSYAGFDIVSLFLLYLFICYYLFIYLFIYLFVMGGILYLTS